MYLIIEEVVRGDRGDATNPFQWSHIRLNLPGSVTYDPSKAWITKRRTDESLASEVVDFVDDERVVGSGEDRVLAPAMPSALGRATWACKTLYVS